MGEGGTEGERVSEVSYGNWFDLRQALMSNEGHVAQPGSKWQSSPSSYARRGQRGLMGWGQRI